MRNQIDFVPSERDCRNVLNQQCERLRGCAVDGYAAQGRGCLVCQFAFLDGWNLAVLYRSLDQLAAAGIPAEIVPDAAELIDSYKPETECVFILGREDTVFGVGIYEFDPA